jgi:2-succinyl-5-enolpyruvyl-6-hydroxy-3-cyclohexene-1-carboxylate synthase
VSRALDDLVEADGLGPLAVAREVSAALPPGGQLYVGASNPIRDLDLMAARYEVGRRRKVLANRGCPGSTAPCPARSARPSPGRARATCCWSVT